MALGQHRIEYEVLEGWDRLHGKFVLKVRMAQLLSSSSSASSRRPDEY